MLNSMSSAARLSARPDSSKAAAAIATAHAAHAVSPAGAQAHVNGSDPYVHHRLQVIKLNLSKSDRDGYLYVPPTYSVEAGPSPLLVMLHGAGGKGKNTLATFGELSVFDKDRCLLLVPESRGSTWDMIRKGFGPDVDYINSALEHVFSRYSIDTSRLGLAGFSDGASYALSLGLPNGDLFSHIVAFSPGFMRPPAVEGNPKVYISHGVYDQVLGIDFCSRRLVPRLQQILPKGEMHYVEFDGAHIVRGDIAQEALDWFLEGRPIEESTFSRQE